MIGHSAGPILASAGGILENVDRKWRGLLVIGTVALLAYGAGIWTRDEVASYESIEPRVTSLEDWRVVHMQEVTEPALERLETLEDRWESRAEPDSVMREMIRQMYCEEIFPNRCPRGLPQ